MERHNAVIINQDACTGCGLCIRVCPTRSLSMVGGKARMTSFASISCGHCEAVCPAGAVKVPVLDPSMRNFSSFTPKTEWIRPGTFDPAFLVQLMASQRSCRNYTEQTVDRSVLEDLVKIGITAPSGTNCQHWTFTLLPDRASLRRFAELIVAFYRKLNAMAAKPVMRKGLKLIGKGELDAYYRQHFKKVNDAMVEWEKTGRDLLFHGAAAAIIVGSRPGASCPAEDAMLATQNILLGAHSLGLGTCLIGFASAAMQRDRSIQKALGIPEEEGMHAVVAVGYPDEIYQRVTHRKTAVIRYSEG
ncbi:MAG TPA: nitroreductase family protein [Dissulfurispiraceae bacterium]|nr:nitroreductase family protein [Dissulfurispiraceae bacterium]